MHTLWVRGRRLEMSKTGTARAMRKVKLRAPRSPGVTGAAAKKTPVPEKLKERSQPKTKRDKK
jgi:hypothetical protein